MLITVITRSSAGVTEYTNHTTATRRREMTVDQHPVAEAPRIPKPVKTKAVESFCKFATVCFTLQIIYDVAILASSLLHVLTRWVASAFSTLVRGGGCTLLWPSAFPNSSTAPQCLISDLLLLSFRLCLVNTCRRLVGTYGPFPLPPDLTRVTNQCTVTKFPCRYCPLLCLFICVVFCNLV